MDKLTFVPINETGWRILNEWFQRDEDMLYLSSPTPEYYQYLRNEPNAHGWMVFAGETSVAFVQLDVEGENGYPAFAVNPELRRRGYGKRMLRALLARPEVAPLTRLIATAIPENLASQRCLEAAGFVLESPELDKDGFMRYVYQVPK